MGQSEGVVAPDIANGELGDNSAAEALDLGRDHDILFSVAASEPRGSAEVRQEGGLGAMGIAHQPLPHA